MSLLTQKQTQFEDMPTAASMPKHDVTENYNADEVTETFMNVSKAETNISVTLHLSIDGRDCKMLYCSTSK